MTRTRQTQPLLSGLMILHETTNEKDSFESFFGPSITEETSNSLTIGRRSYMRKIHVQETENYANTLD